MYGSLKPINRLERILDEILATAGKDSLVVWDIDDVILTPKDKILRKCSRSYLNSILDELKTQSHAEYTEQYCLAWHSTEEELVEASMLSIWGKIRDHKIRQIALSAPPAGKQGVIPDMHEFRRQALLRFDIDFSYSFGLDPLWLKGSDPDHPPPFFKDGVIIGGLHGKGLVLVDFLTKTGFSPSHVFFIDDLIENLLNVTEHLQGVSTPHTLFHYDSYVLQQEEMIKDTHANLQFALLKSHGVWINDVHFEAILKHLSNSPS